VQGGAREANSASTLKAWGFKPDEIAALTSAGAI
jgi:hypothetical protein